MQVNKKQHVILSIIGHLGMIGILVMAYTLWLERGTTFDSSLYSYTIILRESFYIPHQRRINFLWQWIPILGVKSGVSLPTFLKLMSVAPILFVYGIYILICHGMKNALAGLYLVLSLVILTRFKFYSAISEIYLSTVFVALLLSWMTIDRSRFINLSKSSFIGMGILIISFAYFGHPLIFFPIGVAILFDYLMLGKWKSFPHFIWLISSGLIFAIKYFSVGSGSYEGKAVDNFQNEISAQGFLARTADLYSAEIFWNYVETQWAFPLVACLSMLLYLIAKKKILAAALVLCSTSVWVIFVLNFCAYLTMPTLFMIEGYFGFIGLLMLLPLVYIQINTAWFHNLRVGLIICLIVFGLHRITSVRPFYTTRIADITQRMAMSESAASRNMLAPISAPIWEKYWFVWSVPFESMLHSSLRLSGKTSIISFDNQPKEALFEQPFEVMLGTDRDSIHLMNSTYFDMDSRPFVRVE